MSHKAKISGAVKITAIEQILRGEYTLNRLAKTLGIKNSSIRQWLQTYQSLGPIGLLNTSKNAAYSQELKITAVQDYLAGGGSYMELCKRYGIKSTKQLRNWILKYNSHEELKASGTGGAPIMTNGRKTTFEERIEIVRFCIENQQDYTQAAQQFQVSYQQVYSWTNKYLKSGIDALQDRRGKRKLEEEMTEIERLRAQNSLLQAENRRKQMEIDFLKKLKELERGPF
ncbi:transposase [Brevibacillus reuszeri]|uniref:transposase n=1 Tax=Brevibacillus reuszeri TaxID=54915 RepID=UPI003D23AD2E